MDMLDEISKSGCILYRKDDGVPQTIIEAMIKAGCEICRVDEVLEMYYLFDFSDKVQLLTESNQFPSLFNYVKSGLLTEEELLQAMLCK